MPAEWESRDLHAETFDMTYAWSWNETMHRFAMGKADLEQLKVYYAWNDKAYPRGVMRMTFVSNHDKNSWEGTEFEQFGDALEAAIGAAVVGEGMPLIYSGQEAGNDRWLESSSGIRSCGASTRRANCIESCLRSGAPTPRCGTPGGAPG